MSHKKLIKGHWNVGKACKGNRKAKERVDASKDIQTQIAQQDEDFRDRPVSKRKKTLKSKVAKLEAHIEWCERVIADYKRDSRRGSWSDYLSNYCRGSLVESKKKIEELKAKIEEEKDKERRDAVRSQ